MGKGLDIFIGMKAPRGDTGLEGLADLLAGCVLAAGHTPLVAYREIERRGLAEPEVFMPFVRQAIRASDLVLILYHPELRGGLIEAGIAYGLNKPVWLIYPAGQRVSSSARGCASRNIVYLDAGDLQRQLGEALEQGLAQQSAVRPVS